MEISSATKSVGKSRRTTTSVRALHQIAPNATGSREVQTLEERIQTLRNAPVEQVRGSVVS